MGRDVCANRAVWRVADSLADLCAGGRAGSVEFGLTFAIALRILSAVPARGSCGFVLNTRGFFGVWQQHACGYISALVRFSILYSTRS